MASPPGVTTLEADRTASGKVRAGVTEAREPSLRSFRIPRHSIRAARDPLASLGASLHRAEGEGFEPPETFASVVFKTTAIGRSASPPGRRTFCQNRAQDPVATEGQAPEGGSTGSVGRRSPTVVPARRDGGRGGHHWPRALA